MEAWIDACEHLRTLEWSGTLRERKSIFIMKEELDKLAGSEFDTETQTATETKAAQEQDDLPRAV